jgi:hypothetical protein
MVTAMILTTLIETLGLGPRPLACSFPGPSSREIPIEVVVRPKPSLKDIPGLYRAEMIVNEILRLPAAAQPIITTETRDVMIRAAEGEHTFYTVGFDDRGRAALNIMITSDPDTVPHEATRTGRCRDFERYIQRWSAL